MRRRASGRPAVRVLHRADGDQRADTVYGADPERTGRVASRLRVGAVNVNGGIWYSADMPFGGYKQSGVGREMGLAGFEEYLETKAIAAAVE